MAVYLAYIEPVAGRLYPIIPTLQELGRRGHRVIVRTGIPQCRLLQSIGIDSDVLAPELAEFEPRDWQARTRFGALIAALNQFGQRARPQRVDVQDAIATHHPDVVILDETSWGAAAAAEASGLPWVFSLPSPVPIPSPDAPPFGLGLAPRHDAVGHLRDRAVAPLTIGTLGRVVAHHVNPVRADLGLSLLHTLEDFYLAATLLLAFTAEPFEYHRRDWPAKVRLVGPGFWEPPSDPPSWLDDLRRPVVLVTCSTAFQNDVRLAEVACQALASGRYDVILTTGDVELGRSAAPPNVHVERFVPHMAVLGRAACTVCHAGMGITQKSLAQGVPVVAVPFGRDQPEVARRVEVARAGVRLPARKLTPARLSAAIGKAIDLRGGAERIAATFRHAGGAQAAADSLESLPHGRSEAQDSRETNPHHREP